MNVVIYLMSGLGALSAIIGMVLILPFVAKQKEGMIAIKVGLASIIVAFLLNW